MDDVVMVGGVRTPIGRFGGGSAPLDAVTLGSVAVQGAVERSVIDPDGIGGVLLGHGLRAGAGENAARQAAIAAGLGMHVPADTLNEVRLSSMSAIAHGPDLLRLGEVVVAGGGRGAASLCGGGRQGEALLVEVEA
jgi:acetyl-CoA C-acetyltransferase